MDSSSSARRSPPPSPSPSPSSTPTFSAFRGSSRRNSADSIRSASSASSGNNAEIERFRAEIAQQDQEIQQSAIGLGITRGSTKVESEPFNYRGVQSAPRPLPYPPRREPLPVVERPAVAGSRGRSHSRSSSLTSRPSTEDLPGLQGLDIHAAIPPRARLQQREQRPSVQETLQTPPRLTSAIYVPPQTRKMNYQGFDPSQSGQASNSRQAPPSPSQGMAHTNGMNGQMNMAGMANMIGFPTPAGHQSDLNYIMVMVEELSRLLASNQKITDSILEKIGNVRQRAKDKNLSNDELLAIVSEELNAGSENLETENAQLRRLVEESKADADENWKLVLHAAGILEDIKEKAHSYKFQHEKDTLAWHKSYRDQLAQERKENLELRCHIADMQAHAAKANDYINQLRRYASEHKIINELRIENARYRSARRFWKRMACPLLTTDPSEWSDDEGGATGQIPEAEKIACASYIAEREEMGRSLLNDPSFSAS